MESTRAAERRVPLVKHHRIIKPWCEPAKTVSMLGDGGGKLT